MRAPSRNSVLLSDSVLDFFIGLKIPCQSRNRDRAARYRDALRPSSRKWHGLPRFARISAWHIVCKVAAMSVLGDLVRDFRYAARSLARSPGFTVVAVAVLALGIGATSAIFSLVSAVWLRPLPFADAERIVTLWVDLTAVGGPETVNIAPANFVDWQERSRSFESMSALEPMDFNLTGEGGEPERLAGLRASP